MSHVLKTGVVSMLMVGALVAMTPLANADDNAPHRGKISGRSVVAGVLSFLVWPGIGQAVNSEKGDKVVTHAVAGLIPPFRFWSGYDALVDRSGGYWHGRI